MKHVARQKLFEQYGSEPTKENLRERQTAIAQAWLAGFRSAHDAVCPYDHEQLIQVWGAGRREAQER